MVKAYRISVLDTGEIFFCNKEEPILEAMKRSGKGPVHYGCFGGGCGVCKMKIVSGDYHIAKKMSRAHISEEEQSHDIVLICCVVPDNDLTISIEL